MKRTHTITALLALALPLAPAAASAEALFWSTQAKPVEETQAMREQVLAGFPGGVDYQGMDNGPWLTRIQAELQAGSGTIAVLGGLHGDLSGLAAALREAAERSGESVYRIAKNAGVDQSTLNKFLNGDRDNLTLAVADRLFKYFGLRVVCRSRR